MNDLYELISEFKKNNNFDDIYNFYRKKIINITQKFKIDEYVSDMFYHLWIIVKKIDLTLLTTGILIHTYISRSLKIFAINYYKKKKREKLIIYNTEVASIELDKKFQYNFDDSSFTFKDTLKKFLSDKQYYIINLRYVDCLSDIEIAKRLNISRQAVYKNRISALSNLRKSFIL